MTWDIVTRLIVLWENGVAPITAEKEMGSKQMWTPSTAHFIILSRRQFLTACQWLNTFPPASPVGTTTVVVARIMYSVSTSLVPTEPYVWGLAGSQGERMGHIIYNSLLRLPLKRGLDSKQWTVARQLRRWRRSWGFTSPWIRLDINPAKRRREKKTCYRLLSQLPLCGCFFVLLSVWLVNKTPSSSSLHWKKKASKYVLLEYLCRWVISY